MNLNEVRSATGQVNERAGVVTTDIAVAYT